MSWANALQKMTLTRSMSTCVHLSLRCRQNLLSSLKTTDCHSTLQSTLSQHQSSQAWWCNGVSGSLVRGTHDLSPAASRWFPMVLVDTANATCAQISSLDAVQAATVTHAVRRSHVYLYHVAVQNLVCRCGICPFSLTQTCNTNSLKWLKLFNRSMNSRSTTVTACRGTTEGKNTGLLSAI